MVQCKWIIALDEIDVILVIKHGKHKRALDKLSHFGDRLNVEGFLLFKKLNCYVAIRLDWSIRQRYLLA